MELKTKQAFCLQSVNSLVYTDEKETETGTFYYSLRQAVNFVIGRFHSIRSAADPRFHSPHTSRATTWQCIGNDVTGTCHISAIRPRRRLFVTTGNFSVTLPALCVFLLSLYTYCTIQYVPFSAMIRTV